MYHWQGIQERKISKVKCQSITSRHNCVILIYMLVLCKNRPSYEKNMHLRGQTGFLYRHIGDGMSLAPEALINLVQ